MSLVPWLKPWWIRLLSAIVVSILFALVGIFVTGGPTPPEGQSGGWKS